MVDTRDHQREDFVIDKSYAAEEVEDLRREEYLGKSAEVFRSKSIIPYAVGGVGLIVLAIVLVFFLSGPKDAVGRKDLQTLEERIEQLEKRMATVGAADQALERISRQEEGLNRLSQRLSRLESTVTTQIDQILKDIITLHQKAAQTPGAVNKPAPPVVKKNSVASTPQGAASKYHQVQAGETLYRISRRYGLTVEQLRSYNKLESDAAIYPGQKLKLSPN